LLEPGVTVIYGNNGNGKSNLLEAIYILSVGKSQRAINDKDLISFNSSGIDATNEGLEIHTKVSANIQRSDESTKIQFNLFEIDSSSETSRYTTNKQQNHRKNLPRQKSLTKLVRVNGIRKKISDFVGEVNAVLFTVQDLELIYGAPKIRRRYLDMLISQHDREYLRALQRYQKTIFQRNHLLRNIKSGVSKLPELAPWDQNIMDDGGYIISTRSKIIKHLSELCISQHHLLSPLKEQLKLMYLTDTEETISQAGHADISDVLKDKLSASLNFDINRGFTSVGPHRDDFKVTINGLDSARFASRGQARIATLSIKLAEAQYLSDVRGENPLILLDDVFSELDPVRRELVWDLISNYEQSLITTSDMDNIPKDGISNMKKFKIFEGKIDPVD